jgi:dCTP diphosphatase
VNDIDGLRERLQAFSAERDWEKFHSPKNLLLAMVGEVGELAELVQWVEPADIGEWMQDVRNSQAVSHELADVFAYLIQLADALSIDLVTALSEKIDLNELKYPAELSRGRAAKYDEL